MLKHFVYKAKCVGLTHRIHAILRKSSRKMSFVSVRKVDTEDRVQISFTYSVINNDNCDYVGSQSTGNGKSRSFNLDRLASEELEKTLARIQANVSKLYKKKNKPKKSKIQNDGASNEEIVKNSNDEGVDVKLLAPNKENIQGDIANELAWQEGGILVIGMTELPIRINVPVIKELSLPTCILAGFTAYPKLDGEFVDLSKCKFSWSRESLGSCPDGDSPKEDKWNIVYEGLNYLPSNQDINHRLKLTCIPSNGNQEGVAKEAVNKETVSAGPGFCPFENRHEYTKTFTDSTSVRVMTYNILANLYADSDFSRDVLYPYCPHYALDKSYRKQLLIKEILGYHGDVLCLQEVDRSLFVNDYLPILESHGYQGAFCMKAAQAHEGNAMFYRKDKFRLLSQHDIVLTEVLKGEPLYKDIWDKVSTNQVLADKIKERSTVMQVMLLESLESPHQRILIGTTHLYFHPRASHIRIIQTVICLRHLASVAEQCTTEASNKPAIIFCGDLNSYPMGGVHHYIDKKSIPDHHPDWYAGGKDEFTENMSFTHDLDLVSACGFPQYTNFVASFAGCLDYIYVERQKLKPSMVVPMPTHEEVTQYSALPNPVFPSDHIALICDLKWT